MMNGESFQDNNQPVGETANSPTIHGTVLSVRQPWAWLLIRPDITDPVARARAFAAREIKDVENRNWPTKIRGRVLIHASKGMTREEYEFACAFVREDVSEQIPIPAFGDLQRGGIIGEVDILNCVANSTSPWFMGEYGFVTRDSKPLPFYPCKGQLGFFKI